MNMRAITRAAGVLVAMLIATSPAQSADAPVVTAAFTASVAYGEEAPLLDFTGRLLLSGPKLRVELTQPLTDEALIVLLDYDAGNLTLLYPDTLNGERYSLDAFDSIDGFPRLREALDGLAPAVPDGWRQTSHGTAQLDGRQCQHFSAESEDGLTVHWWTRADNRPVKVIATAADATLTVHLSDYDTDAAASAADFEVPEGYTLSEPAADMPDQLPDLGRTI